MQRQIICFLNVYTASFWYLALILNGIRNAHGCTKILLRTSRDILINSKNYKYYGNYYNNKNRNNCNLMIVRKITTIKLPTTIPQFSYWPANQLHNKGKRHATQSITELGPPKPKGKILLWVARQNAQPGSTTACPGLPHLDNFYFLPSRWQTPCRVAAAGNRLRDMIGKGVFASR